MSNESLVLTMNTTIPLRSGMTVKDLIAVLEMVPDKNARVMGRHTAADRFGSDSYRLELNWTKVMGE